MQDTTNPPTPATETVNWANTGQENLIVTDLETSGLDPKRACILSIGAVDYNSGKEFYGECSVYFNSHVDPVSLEINGFKLEDIQPRKKQSPAELFWSFVEWAKQFPRSIIGGHNPGHFDILFLEEACTQYFPKTKFPFSYRTVDLHSLAFARFGESLKMSDICRRLGIPPEPKPHNALEGARSERAAFRALMRQDEDARIFSRKFAEAEEALRNITSSYAKTDEAADLQAIAREALTTLQAGMKTNAEIIVEADRKLAVGRCFICDAFPCRCKNPS